MSSESPSPFPSSQRQPTWSFKIQNFSTPQTYAAKPVTSSRPQASVVAPTPPTIGGSEIGDAAKLNAKVHTSVTWSRKRRRLNKEEEETRDQIADAVRINLSADQAFALYPDIDTPFSTEVDVVKRLLPYHIYQQPQHDLDCIRKIKGKGKVTGTDLLREEIKETRFALECHKRFRALEKRMQRAKMKPGEYASPLNQSILLERLALETEQYDSTALDHELTSARSELDKVLRTRKAAKANADRSTLTTSAPQVSSYYNYTTPTFSASMTSNYPNYYSSFTYPYSTQTHLPGAPYIPPSYSNSPTVTPAYKAATSTATQTPTPTTPAPPVRPPPVAIPLQLPVTSLPALQALGILPVPKASLPPLSEPQPAAVLLGSTNNGSMLSLEINAAQLQAPQMSGLAVLLSSLVKMSGGQNGSAQTTQATQGVPQSTIASSSNESPAN